MKKVRIKKIGNTHGDGRVWMLMLPNECDWWTHYYLRSFDEAVTKTLDFLGRWAHT